MEPAASHLNDLLAGPDEAGTSLEGMNEQEVVKAYLNQPKKT